MKSKKRLAFFSAAAITLGSLLSPASAQAAVNDTYVSLGADLSSSQKETVLGLLHISKADLASYKVVTITNAEEHTAYDKYLSKKVIGTRALSCAKVTQKEDGYGIQVQTQNIDYCTVSMYQNALATAGMQNADVIVAGPTKLSGTAALLGVTKAYSELTGKSLKPEALDAAAQELVVTSNIGEQTGDKEKAAELVASVKEEVASGKLDPSKVDSAINSASKQLGISLTSEQKSQIADLMKKIDKLDINVDTLKQQVGKLYDKLAAKGIDLQITKEEAKSWIAKIADWFRSIWNQLFH